MAISLQRSGQALPEPAGEPAAFVSPLTPQDLKDLRWYLEDYLVAPFAVYEERGKAIEGKLAGWGEALFAALFGEGAAGRDTYNRAREASAAAELLLASHSAEFLGLPWELLRDPRRATPLALDFASIDRTLPAEGMAAETVAGEVLRVLMVIARPAGVEDVGYQMIARPLLRRLEAVSGKVDLEVLRPPTLEALKARLGEAAVEGRPIQILHFDGHGAFGTKQGGAARAHLYEGGALQGYLLFEKEGGGDDLVSASDFAVVVNQVKVPLVVLNACRSGTLGESTVEAAVATRLLEGGAASVVAMGYSVYAVAAAEFMASFYETLFAAGTVSQAVADGRRQMARRKERPSPKGRLPLEDWIVPVHYMRRVISFPKLQRTRAAGKPSLSELLDRMRGTAPTATAPHMDPLVAIGRFVGRDTAFYTLELALRWQRVAVVHGPGGTGKTELAKAFGRWWRASGGVGQPDWVLFHSFEPGLASFGLDGVVTEIGLQVFGSDFVGKTRDAEERQQVVLDLLKEHRLLLIWDNFESVHSLPDPSGATPPLKDKEREAIRTFLEALGQNGRSCVIITSRSPEPWLGNVRRVPLGGLTPSEAAEMAEEVLAPYPGARQRMGERAFGELMAWLDGHPLSLRLMLPHLEAISPAALLDALKGNALQLPPGFDEDTAIGRLQSLGASVKYSLDHLEPDMRARVSGLALFEGVADEDVLALFSEADGVPARFAGITTETWSALLKRLSAIGLVTPLGGGTYGLHPALPAYLAAQWRRDAGSQYEAERLAADGALLAAYARFGDWLLNQIRRGSAETALALVELQRRTMGRLLGLALDRQLCGRAQSLLQPLDLFWEARGLRQEARGWIDRCRTALEVEDGTPPDLESEAGALWLFAAGSEATSAIRAGDLDSARAIYDAIRQRLEASTGASRKMRLAVTYHQLGRVAEDGGELDTAEALYRKSLEIKEEIGDQPGMASSYHQLGIVAQRRGKLDAAEDWYKKSLQIEKALGNRLGMAGSYHHLGLAAQDRDDLDAAEGWYQKALEIKEALGDLPSLASSYHQLGMVAQRRGKLDAAERWYRRSLEIEQSIGSRPGMAGSFGQLGLLAVIRKEPEVALDWMVRCVALFPQFPHPATGPGPKNLAILTDLIGIPALEASWKRCTGAALPEQVRIGIEQMIDASKR